MLAPLRLRARARHTLVNVATYLYLLSFCLLADAERSTSVQCSASRVADCTEGHRNTFNELINIHSKSLLHGIDAAAITQLCTTHKAALSCLKTLATNCPKTVEAEARKLHNLTRLCNKLTSSDLMETYSLHQRCLQSKTKKAVDECWITFHGDTDGDLSPWVHSYPRNTRLMQQIVSTSSETRTRKIHLAVCLLQHCLEETLRTKCDDGNTAYEKQAWRLVSELIAPLPPFSVVTINCTAFREEYENYQTSPERQISRTSSSASSFLPLAGIKLAGLTVAAMIVFR